MDRADIKKLKALIEKDGRITFHQATDTVIWFKTNGNTFSFYVYDEAKKWLQKAQ